MRELDVSLIEWPQGRPAGGPRILGTSSDPKLVKIVHDRLAADRRRALAELEPPVRLVRPEDGDDPTPDGPDLPRDCEGDFGDG